MGNLICACTNPSDEVEFPVKSLLPERRANNNTNESNTNTSLVQSTTSTPSQEELVNEAKDAQHSDSPSAPGSPASLSIIRNLSMTIPPGAISARNVLAAVTILDKDNHSVFETTLPLLRRTNTPEWNNLELVLPALGQGLRLRVTLLEFNWMSETILAQCEIAGDDLTSHLADGTPMTHSLGELLALPHQHNTPMPILEEISTTEPNNTAAGAVSITGGLLNARDNFCGYVYVKHVPAFRMMSFKKSAFEKKWVTLNYHAMSMWNPTVVEDENRTLVTTSMEKAEEILMYHSKQINIHGEDNPMAVTLESRNELYRMAVSNPNGDDDDDDEVKKQKASLLRVMSNIAFQCQIKLKIANESVLNELQQE